MDSLPNEIIDHIFRLLTRNELLNIRIVSRKWNTFSLKVFNCSNLNIGYRNNDQVVEFCEMMKENTCGLKFQKFFLSFLEREQISFFNWTQLYNEINSYVTEYYFFIFWDCEEDSKIINMILNNAPNLKILYIHTRSDFPKPNFNTLQKVEVLQLETHSIRSNFEKSRKVDLEIVVKWIEKFPSLKKLHCQFSTIGSNSSEMSKYFQYLQRIPEVSLYVYLFEDHEKQLNELSLIPITKLRLDIENANGGEVGHALNLFLKKQSGRLQHLQFDSISKITNLLLPSLPKLETFILVEYAYVQNPEIPPGNFLTFDPKNFMSLRRVMIHSFEVEPFIGGVYPTVENLVVFTYSILNWRSIFPNLRKFTTSPCMYSLPEQRLEEFKHVLANLPTDHHLKLGIGDLELLKYLIFNPPPVAKLEIFLEDWDSKKDEVIGKRLWNTLTGHARVEHDSILCIEGVNNIGIPQEMGIQPSILNIKNLYKLRVELDLGGTEFLKSISLLSQQKESFKAMKKMIITDGDYNEFKLLSTWNFNTEIRWTPYHRSTVEPTFSREKMPEIIMYRMYNNYNKYAVKYVV